MKFVSFTEDGGYRVEESHLITVLANLDIQERKPYLRATSLDYLGGGGSEAWRCEAEDGQVYVVKAQNNGQDRIQACQANEPLKILTTELICGRLGQLFHPIVCPEVAIIDIPERLASNAFFPDRRPVSAGPSFGSLWYPDMYDIKVGGRIDIVPPDQIARIIVFQTWLRGDDRAALVSGDGRKGVSIDHGYYLAGAYSWDREKLDNPLPVTPVLISPSHQPIDATTYRAVLEELQMFPDVDILKAFSSIPVEWGGTINFRAKLAHNVLQRRLAVEQAISTIWKEVTIW